MRALPESITIFRIQGAEHFSLEENESSRSYQDGEAGPPEPLADDAHELVHVKGLHGTGHAVFRVVTRNIQSAPEVVAVEDVVHDPRGTVLKGLQSPRISSILTPPP